MQDVGKAIDRNTPDIDLTKNPKAVTKDVGKAIKNALPDVSAVPTAEEIRAKVSTLTGFLCVCPDIVRPCSCDMVTAQNTCKYAYIGCFLHAVPDV